MEDLLAEKNPTGKFCHGDSSTVADICLVTQVTPTQLFNTNIEPFKRVIRIYDACIASPAFVKDHPRNQLDFEGTDPGRARQRSTSTRKTWSASESNC
jgi:glutathione S-transferase